MHTLLRHARWCGRPDASQEPSFLQVSVALSDSTHLDKKPQTTSTHPKANMGTIAMHQT
jgi:hypothetical protein